MGQPRQQASCHHSHTEPRELGRERGLVRVSETAATSLPSHRPSSVGHWRGSHRPANRRRIIPSHRPCKNASIDTPVASPSLSRRIRLCPPSSCLHHLPHSLRHESPFRALRRPCGTESLCYHSGCFPGPRHPGLILPAAREDHPASDERRSVALVGAAGRVELHSRNWQYLDSASQPRRHRMLQRACSSRMRGCTFGRCSNRLPVDLLHVHVSS